MRLTSKDRSLIREKLLACVVVPSKAHLDAEIEQATCMIEERVSAWMSPEEAEVLKKFGLLGYICAIRWNGRSEAYGANGYGTVRLSRQVDVPALPNLLGTVNPYYGELDPIGLKGDDFDFLYRAYAVYIKEMQNAASSIDAVLYPSRTDKALIDLWPEAAPIVESVMGEKPVPAEQNPAIDAIRNVLPRLNTLQLSAGKESP